MQWYEFYDLSERYHRLINPSSPEKVIKAGEVAGMSEGRRVIEFGAGFAEPLVLWAEQFGITGVGVEFRPYACQRARERIAERGLGDRIQIVEGDAKAYEFERGVYDVGVCLGASFIWEGYRRTVQVLKQTIQQDGKLIIGEVFQAHANVPPESAKKDGMMTMAELLEITGEEGLVIEYFQLSNSDEWDSYESANSRSFCAWLRENPDHPDRAAVKEKFFEWQCDYLMRGRLDCGWGIFVLGSV